MVLIFCSNQHLWQYLAYLDFSHFSDRDHKIIHAKYHAKLIFSIITCTTKAVSIISFIALKYGEESLDNSILISVNSDRDHKRGNRSDLRTIYGGLRLTPEFIRSIFVSITLAPWPPSSSFPKMEVRSYLCTIRRGPILS